MNRKFLKHYMETEPEGTAQKYILLVNLLPVVLLINAETIIATFS